MIGQELLTERKSLLMSVLKNGLKASRSHTTAFVLRVLPQDYRRELEQAGAIELAVPLDPTYGGYPDVAFLGFMLAAEPTNAPLSQKFFEGCERLRKRDVASTKPFFLDDVAVLGVAEGLCCLPKADAVRGWLLDGIERSMGHSQWSSRMRQLAADLLDSRGRLKVALSNSQVDALALELVLSGVWTNAFSQTYRLSQEIQYDVLKRLLSDPPPNQDDIERAAVWLIALDRLVTVASYSLLPTISDTARILRDVEHSFKRWKWEQQPRQGAAFASQWLIDNEYDVQSLLWAILYPIYGAELVDETYLPNWGQTQPRADLGIQKLKLIIEVKFLREPRDFNEVEAEIGKDLGLYFKDTDLYNRMIAFIYDDCDNHQPQLYDGLRNALIKREQIEDVIIVRRPGMLPSRSERRKRQAKQPSN
jgi:hypothetical protein